MCLTTLKDMQCRVSTRNVLLAVLDDVGNCKPVDREMGPHTKEQLKTFQCFSVHFQNMNLG